MRWMVMIVLIAMTLVGATWARELVPRAWDERAIERAILPPPVAGVRVEQITADYYYRMRERVIYRHHPVYSSSAEPAGYLARLAQVEPEVSFDPTAIETENDWTRAGREVFYYPVRTFPLERLAAMRGALEQAGIRPANDGTYPQLAIVVAERGRPMVGFLACATCHTRVQADGTVIEGGQGSVPDSLLGFPPSLEGARAFQRALFRVPWLKDDPAEAYQRMTVGQINAVKAAIPVGVVARHGTSLFSPVQIPDLIGVRERRYLDHTGLMKHTDIGDLMRYAALNQDADMLADYDGYRPTAFVPGANLKDDNLPPPESLERYSDAQLRALGRFVYSLQPPLNRNRQSPLSERGKQVFARAGCPRCHTPPLYTSNKITPAVGFDVPIDHKVRFDVEPTIVGTDPTLAMRTRRSTGYYKIPSLKGVWYRGPFEHNGSVATLEDWFDSKRLRPDYVPTGWVGYGVNARAVPGHPFGLDLTADDKKALIAFLKTL
jgi:hypothetical protein